MSSLEIVEAFDLAGDELVARENVEQYKHEAALLQHKRVDPLDAIRRQQASLQNLGV